MMEWLLAVAQRLEYEGICANGEILLGDVLEQREVSATNAFDREAHAGADTVLPSSQGYSLH
jgi:hypothetical protein